jgi:hypothetical protein
MIQGLTRDSVAPYVLLDPRALEGKSPSAQSEHAKVLKVIGAHAVPWRARFLAHFAGERAAQHNGIAPVVGEGLYSARPLPSNPGVRSRRS